MPTVGARRPRVETHGPIVESYGDEACALLEMAGQPLDPWQGDAMRAMLAVRSDGKWQHFEYAEIVSRQNGKGAILEARALTGLLLLDERLIMWSAHEFKTAIEAFRRVVFLVRRLGKRTQRDNVFDIGGVLVKVNNTNGEESIERLDTGARVKFLARTKGSGRGFSGDCNIIDEAFAYTAEQQAALMPTMSARPNPQVIYTSSPPLTGDTGEVMYSLRKRGERGDDESLCWRDWGLPGALDDLDGVDLKALANWAAANPSMGIRITPETIGRELRSMSAVDFARERLGIWPREITAGNGAIDLELWADLADAESQREGGVMFAVDVTPTRDRAAIAVRARRPDGLAHWEIIEDRPGVDWIVPRLVALKKRHNPLAFVLDGKGPAASLITALDKAGIREPEHRDEPKRGDLIVSGPQDMADAFGMFVDAVRQREGRHRDQAPLTSALAGARTRPCGDGGTAWGRKGSANIAPLVAVTLAHWAFETRAHVIEADYDALDNIW